MILQVTRQCLFEPALIGRSVAGLSIGHLFLALSVLVRGMQGCASMPRSGDRQLRNKMLVMDLLRGSRVSQLIFADIYTPVYVEDSLYR